MQGRKLLCRVEGEWLDGKESWDRGQRGKHAIKAHENLKTKNGMIKRPIKGGKRITGETNPPLRFFLIAETSFNTENWASKAMKKSQVPIFSSQQVSR